MSKQSSKSSGVGLILLILGIPFLAVGLGMAWGSVHMLNKVMRARQWATVPAHIQSVDLKSSSDSDSNTYNVVAEYSYEYKSQRYQNHRVGIAGGSDNIGDWHQRIYDRLKQAKLHDQPVDCYVNPANPSESFLDRDLRFPLYAFYLLFATVFGSVGFGFIIAILIGRREAKQASALKDTHPDEPWMHQADWASGTITAGLRLPEVILWSLAIYWNLVASPIVFLLPAEMSHRHNYLMLLTLLFPAIGLLLLALAFRASARRRKFGGTYVQLTTIPGVIGGHLAGRVMLSGDLAGLDQITIDLNCMHTYTTGSGDNRTTKTESLWSDSLPRDLAIAFGQTQIELPFDFVIPYDCRPTDTGASSDQINWKLTARGDAPGVDLSLDYKVPVFRTPKSDPNLHESAERAVREKSIIESDNDPLPSQIAESTDAEGCTRYRISSWPGFGMFGLLIFFDVLLFAVAIFAYTQVIRQNRFMLIFLIAFGGFAVLLFFVLLGCLDSYEVTLAQPRRLIVRRRLGLLGRTKTVEGANVTSVAYSQAMSSNERKWFEVACKTGGFSKVTIARAVPGEVNARWLAHRIEQHLEIPAASTPTTPKPSDNAVT